MWGCSGDEGDILTFNWYAFIAALKKHQKSYVICENKRRYQTRSVFKGFTVPERSDNILPSSEFKEPLPEECEWVERGDNHAYKKQQFTHFAPVFIWLFNRAKKRLADLDEVIHEEKEKIAMAKADILTFTGTKTKPRETRGHREQAPPRTGVVT